MRKGISHLQAGFEHLLNHIEILSKVGNDGFAIAESCISTDWQCTVEGFVHQGKFHVHGVVDSYCETEYSNFSRYQYPSALPQEVRECMAHIYLGGNSREDLEEKYDQCVALLGIKVDQIS
jgi:hypothetical protein